MGKDKDNSELASFVNDYVFEYLQREPEFIDVAEAAEEQGIELSDKKLRAAHGAIIRMLREIAEEAFS